MKTIFNPFEFEGANNLSEEDIINFYIEDYNYTRFIRSTKNIFLVGERGSGKTMTLLFNSFKIQHKIAINDGLSVNFDKIGVHIPCNTPLFHKKEYLLLEEEYKKDIICEHYLVLSVLFNIAKTLSGISEVETDLMKIDSRYFLNLKNIWGSSLDFKSDNFFEDIKVFVNKEIRDTQIKINSYEQDGFYESSYSFSSLLLPFFDFLREIKCLTRSHFLIMIDDAHDMNEYQIRTLNSWIAYRDHSLFSFKIAVAKMTELDKKTSSGGSILEGHDYLSIELGKNLYNKNSDFYHFAKKIIETRLDKVGIKNIPAEDFFPINKDFEKDMIQAREEAKVEAEKNGIEGNTKITEYIKKYHRAIYFRNRNPKANTPPYSGFDMLVDVSTGIIRNLLDPCYWMFDKIANDEKFDINNLTNIDTATQNEIITHRSQALWIILRNGLDKIVPNCTSDEGEHIYRMFDKMMILFKKRLMSNISEPRAVVFSLTGEKGYIREYEYVCKLINIACKAQMLYTRISSGKRIGSKIIYYVPNRMLLPDRGLDVKGQYSQVAIKVIDLYESIIKDCDLPFFLEKEKNMIINNQYKLDL